VTASQLYPLKRNYIESHIMANAEHIVQTTLAALTQADFVGVMEHFKDQFIFIDHAIELEFTDKAAISRRGSRQKAFDGRGCEEAISA
jgi:hypothetical protein